MVTYLTIPLGHGEQRIDNFLFKKFKKIPKSHLYRVIRKGEVRVNKKRISADFRLQEGDVIRIPPLHFAETETINLQPSARWLEMLKTSVIYEDEGMFVINKPSGLAVHGDAATYGVIEVMKRLYPQYPHLELAHRIDKETSGCLLIAKKRSVLKQLHEAFREGQVKKTYLALSLGHWEKKELMVDAPLSRREKKTPECQVLVDRRHGKPSLTRFEVLESFSQASLVLAYPETGRTHQIRVHAAHVGHPLAGDTRYGDASFNQSLHDKGLHRLFLHAQKLILNFPRPLKVEATLPTELTSVLDQLA